MSRRFGRNRKRKLKQEIELLNQQINQQAELFNSTLSMQRITIRELKNELDYVKGVVSFNSGFLAPKTERVDITSDIEYINSPLEMMKNYSSIGEDFDMYDRLSYDVRRIPLMKLKSMDTESGLHFYVRYRDDTYAYAVSEQTVAFTPENLLIENISTLLATGVAKGIKKKYKKP